MEKLNLGIGKFIYTKPCDTCQAAGASVFCRADSLSLCLSCDSTVHTPHARHERVWMCDVCEQAPASVTCKADAAALCATCDQEIHSANPLATRHERVPIVPFYDTADPFAKTIAYGKDVNDCFADVFANTTVCCKDINKCSHTCFPGDETTKLAPSSWTFPNITTKVETDMMEMKSVDFLFSDVDQFLDLDCNMTDSVVPVQTVRSYEKATTQHVMNQMSNKHLEIDFAKPKFNSYSHDPNFGTQCVSQSISSSSMDVGVVPDVSAISDISYPYVQTKGSTINLSDLTGAVPSHGSDREARVMRYREKRKNRKFEKTIRYASRKAYAETRPRIKGRFAKRSETESEVLNNTFISSVSAFMAETAGYGVVPSF